MSELVIAEPLLEVEDIQAHVLTGFGTAHQALLGLKFHGGGSPRRDLLALIRHVTPGARGLEARSRRHMIRHGLAPPGSLAIIPSMVALALSAEGLRALGRDPAELGDSFFREGMARDAAALRDPVDRNGVPLGWVVGADRESTPDVLIVVGGVSEDAVGAQIAVIESDCGSCAEVIWRQAGRMLPGETEHFGFRDGVSQPGMRGQISPGVAFTERVLPPEHPMASEFSRPGQRLTWPGQFIFGYETLQAIEPLTPGPVVGPSWAKNGSLLVMRRLRQDVAAFNAAMRALAHQAGEMGYAISDQHAAAACVGRWPNGGSLVLFPDASPATIDPHSLNGFGFALPFPGAELPDGAGGRYAWPGAPGDFEGRRCPFFAHVRKVNPRDHPPDFATTAATLGMQMLRRGIPYGPAWSGVEDTEDRGLLFMSYQSSINAQFRRLMQAWVNNASRPLSGGGIDPIIGIDSDAAAPRFLTWRLPSGGEMTLQLPGRWVIPTGGGYFFTPSLSLLRELVTH